MNHRELGCQISKGMFSDERAVTCESKWGEISVFVPRDKVHEQNGRSTVSVSAFEYDSSWWALLPTDQPMAIPVEATAFR